MNRFVFLVTIILLSGCASLQPSKKFIIENRSFPELNETTSQELGDTLVSYYRATTAPSYKMGQNANSVMKPIAETERFDYFYHPGFPNSQFMVCLDKKKTNGPLVTH